MHMSSQFLMRMLTVFLDLKYWGKKRIFSSLLSRLLTFTSVIEPPNIHSSLGTNTQDTLGHLDNAYCPPLSQIFRGLLLSLPRMPKILLFPKCGLYGGERRGEEGCHSQEVGSEVEREQTLLPLNTFPIPPPPAEFKRRALYCGLRAKKDPNLCLFLFFPRLTLSNSFPPFSDTSFESPSPRKDRRQKVEPSSPSALMALGKERGRVESQNYFPPASIFHPCMIDDESLRERHSLQNYNAGFLHSI